MKLSLSLRISLYCLLLSSFVIATGLEARAQDPLFALQRGYRAGYSDGYMAGYRDTIDSISRNYSRHREYAAADRAFSSDYGSKEDYRDGYQQGFETGYDTGFERRTFESTLPKNLSRRGVALTDTQTMASKDNSVQSVASSVSTSADTGQNDPSYRTQNATIAIPRDTELVIELEKDLTTKTSREGDKFIARITAPSELNGAIVEGHISKVSKPGKIRRRSELLLAFDRITLSDSRWSNFSAQLIEVMPLKGDNIKMVDSEGTAVGPSSMKSDAIKVGGGAAAGFVTGAIIGGPVGALVGAGVGTAAGVGAVVIERDKHINLTRSQQLRIRTAYETRIR